MAEDAFTASLCAATSSRPVARLRGATELLCREAGLDVAQVNGFDHVLGEHRELTSLGHEESVATFYRSRQFVVSCMGFRQQRERPDELLSWEDIPGFRESFTAREVLRPSGFGNGMSALVSDDRGVIVGVCNVNSVTDHLPPRAKPVLRMIRPVLARLIRDATAFFDLGLSARERQILRLLATGRSNREIGDALSISSRTVSTHIEHVLAKLGVSGRVQAATLAVRVGLVDEG